MQQHSIALPGGSVMVVVVVLHLGTRGKLSTPNTFHYECNSRRLWENGAERTSNRRVCSFQGLLGRLHKDRATTATNTARMNNARRF